MTKRQKRELRSLIRAHGWAASEARTADYATAKEKVKIRYTNTVAKLADVITALGGKSALQVDGAFGQESEEQRIIRADVEVTLRAFNRSAKSLAEELENPALVDRFRLPAGESDAVLAATLRAYAEAIRELDLADEFEAMDHEETAGDLDTMAKTFEKSEADQGEALAGRVGATKVIPELLRKGRAAVKTLDAMFKNRYAKNVELLAAWKTASHVDREGDNDEDLAEGGDAPAPALAPVA